MPESFRCGVYFKAATRPVPVENFMRRVGVTRLDTSDGPQKNKQTFWFTSKAQFDREMPGIIESINAFTVHHPIPVFQAVEVKAEVSEESRVSSSVEQEAHNLQVASSTLAPATIAEDLGPPVLPGSPVAEFPEGSTPQTVEPPPRDPNYVGQTSSGELVYATPPTEGVPVKAPSPAKNKGGRPRKNK